MSNVIEVKVPDIGEFKDVPVIEVLVKAGDNVKAEDSLVTLESDKATMEVPAPAAGVVKELRVKVGDKVSEGALVVMLETADEASAAPPAAEKPAPAAPAEPMVRPAPAPAPQPAPVAPASPPAQPLSRGETEAASAPAGADARIDEIGFVRAHASPSVRRFARELGVDLARVKGSGPKERVLREDVQKHVKAVLARPGAAEGGLGLSPPPLPQVDFAKFGPINAQPLPRIKKLSGANLHRNWLTIPHVTQHDEADITELEEFRKIQVEEAKKQGIRFTILCFLLKAVVVALKQYPQFSASLSADGESLVLKQYFHVGVAVDTPNGLVVPVIRDVDKKGLLELARELGELSERMRAGKISPNDLQGGCFSISSLGGLGGSHFTPIINAPEVAILGVGRSMIKPLWTGKDFAPRLMLPLSVSYDHRVIDGAQGARFIAFLSSVLSDIRRLVL
ncbi:MAG: dihydrolipoyllysine-residue acetyltransferase [Betaproteobacteria bacterium]|nr:dihydrolipoyllysine-residue acetyltransferase [Betaproteobacteria bacterium]MDH3437446.1 dihydrolipoyllysine-residue acetyltransferase [Betaproteobacteria bacterium]